MPERRRALRLSLRCCGCLTSGWRAVLCRRQRGARHRRRGSRWLLLGLRRLRWLLIRRRRGLRCRRGPLDNTSHEVSPGHHAGAFAHASAFAGIKRSIDVPPFRLWEWCRRAIGRYPHHFQLLTVPGLIDQREAKFALALSADTFDDLANCIWQQRPIVPACYCDLDRGHRGSIPLSSGQPLGALARAGGTLISVL